MFVPFRRTTSGAAPAVALRGTTSKAADKAGPRRSFAEPMPVVPGAFDPFVKPFVQVTFDPFLLTGPVAGDLAAIGAGAA